MKKIISGIIRLLPVLAAVLAFTSCDNSGNKIEYVPFKNDEEGSWGLISPEGEVLISDAYEYDVTAATCGRFWVQNKQGYYELYNTDETPGRVNDLDYRYVSLFHDGKAIVAQRNKPMTVINRDGEVLAKLDTVGGKVLSTLQNIKNGYAVAVVDTLQGLIDYEGNWVVAPRYFSVSAMNGGYALAQDHAYGALSYSSDVLSPQELKNMPQGTATVFNEKGETVLTIKTKEYAKTTPRVFGNYLGVAKLKDSTFRWGIIDLEKKVVVAPSDKYAEITEIGENTFVFRQPIAQDDEMGYWHYGVADFSGKVIVKAEHNTINYIAPKMVMVTDYTGDEEDAAARVEYYDLSTGKKIAGRKFFGGTGLLGDHFFAALKENQWKIFDNAGEMLTETPKMYNVNVNLGSDVIMSDYVNLTALIKEIGIGASMLDGMTFGTSVRDALKKQASYYSSTNTPKAADYNYTNEVAIYRSANGVYFNESVIYPTTLSQQTYRTERVIDYVDWWSGTYWYHNRQVPTGYVFTSAKPRVFQLSFDNYGPFYGKLKPLYKALVKKFESLGTKTESNSSASVFSLNNGRQAVVWIDGHNVYAKWGDLNSSEKEIYMYDGNKEDYWLSKGAEEGDL